MADYSNTLGGTEGSRDGNPQKRPRDDAPEADADPPADEGGPKSLPKKRRKGKKIWVFPKRYREAAAFLTSEEGQERNRQMMDAKSSRIKQDLKLLDRQPYSTPESDSLLDAHVIIGAARGNGHFASITKGLKDRATVVYWLDHHRFDERNGPGGYYNIEYVCPKSKQTDTQRPQALDSTSSDNRSSSNQSARDVQPHDGDAQDEDAATATDNGSLADLRREVADLRARVEKLESKK